MQIKVKNIKEFWQNNDYSAFVNLQIQSDKLYTERERFSLHKQVIQCLTRAALMKIK